MWRYSVAVQLSIIFAATSAANAWSAKETSDQCTVEAIGTAMINDLRVAALSESAVQSQRRTGRVARFDGERCRQGEQELRPCTV